MIFGNANGAGEDNRNLGRMASLLAGLPVTVPATTVNRLCGSSLDAAMIASRSIEAGDAEIVIAGGAESMTRSPWVLMKPRSPFRPGTSMLVSTALGWRLVNKRMPPEWTVSLGESNEQLREKFDIPRERQDAFAYRSHQLARLAWEDGSTTTWSPPFRTSSSLATRASATTPRSKLAALKTVSDLTAPSPPATLRRSTTGLPHC